MSRLAQIIIAEPIRASYLLQFVDKYTLAGMVSAPLRLR